MGRIIAIANQKGGVGKTTTAINLSASLASLGKKVLAIDMDPQGNMSSGLGVDKNEVEKTVYDLIIGNIGIEECIYEEVIENLDVLPSNIDLSAAEIELIGVDNKEYILRDEVNKVKEKYDFIIIDCPPALSMLTINAMTTSDSVLVPIQCEYYALEGLSQLIHTIELVQERLNPELYALYLAILVVLAIPLGAYIKNVMSGEKTFLSKVLTPCENLIYKVMRVDREEQMTWKKYAVSVMIFSGIGLVFLFLLQLLQGVLPGNPQNLSGVKWDLAFNTSASFITNTNWQAYSGESTLSYLTQALGLTVQNFVSAATGIAVLFALIRGFIKVKSSGLGSFWVDLTRIVVHILLPLNLVISLLLVGGGVIQNLKSAETVSLVEPIAVSAEGEILEDAVIDLDTETVTVDGEIVSDAQIVTEQFVPMGPAASQVAIKQTGTNGGG